MQFALVLEPEVERARCPEMLFAAMVAFGDAAGAVIPPEVAITYRWPDSILMNDGEVGSACLKISDSEIDNIPDWMVVSLDIKVLADFSDQNPGKRAHETTMWDEGCVEITPVQLLESTSRHMLNAIHNWSEDGFKPVHEQWMGRLCEKQKLAASLDQDIEFIGLDEHGNALVKNGKDPVISTIDALAVSRA